MAGSEHMENSNAEENKTLENKMSGNEISEDEMPESKISESKISESKISESKMPESKISESKILGMELESASSDGKKTVRFVSPKMIMTIVKYLFSLILTVTTYHTTKSIPLVCGGLLELLFIFFLTDCLVRKSRFFNILNGILCFLYNAEMLVLYFSGSFISYVMLSNLGSVRALAGKAIFYISGVVLVFIMSFLPTKSFLQRKLYSGVLAGIMLLITVIFVHSNGIPSTPSTGVYDLYTQWRDYQELQAMVAEYSSGNMQDVFADMENEYDASGDSAQSNAGAGQSTDQSMDQTNRETNSAGSADSEPENKEGSTSGNSTSTSDNSAVYYAQCKTAVETAPGISANAVPFQVYGDTNNVIMVFTEGLSYNIITDDREIMPNVREFSQESLNFTNYYNHTFATYRGIQGQLHSGYQLDDYDPNNLVNLVDVLKADGYYCVMINTEPYDATFTSYLQAQGFDEVITNEEDPENALWEFPAYEMLFSKAEELQASGRKFFLAIYTFGTHASFDTSTYYYGDGSNRMLNKFYNADMCFGNFFTKFKGSDLAANTMIVYTADHCTYSDEDFNVTFPDYSRACSECDEIPLMIYYQGIAGEIDAAGRNSLDMAPTVLDLLGLQKPDTFLGRSLFGAKEGKMTLDTCFWDPGFFMYTGNDEIVKLDNRQMNYMYPKIAAYLAKSTQ